MPAGTAPLDPSRLRARLLLLLALAGLVQCWRYRHFIYPDGIQYVDMARLAVYDDPRWLINGYWSPLYPALIAAAIAILRPAPYWWYPAVQLVNAVSYLAAIAAFDLLWRSLSSARDAGDRTPRLGDAALAVVSGAGFLVFVTYLINVRTMTGDMIVAAATMAAGAFVVRARWPLAGLALAIGYYAKAVMFPVALIFSALMLTWPRSRVPGARGPALMAAAFLLAAAPLVTAVSIRAGHLTFGESGRINYAWYVNGWGPDLHWRGEPPESGRAAHPPARIVENPPAYEFPYPARVTYPLFFDPAYWTDGMRVKPGASQQMAAFARAARELLDAIADVLLAIVPLAVVSLFATPATRDALARHGPVLALAIVPLAVYLPVHVEGRFIGAPLLMLMMVVAASLRVRESRRRSLDVAAAATAFAACAIAGPVLLGALKHTALDLRFGEAREPSLAWRVASALHQAGVPDESDVAAIGSSLGADWAQLGRLHIVAEIGPGDRAAFLSAPPAVRRAVLLRLGVDRARAVVADAPAASVDPDAIDLEQTGFSVFLPRQRIERYARRDGHVQ